ncbi:hypothetical protein ACTMTJ_40725 [Phytohabitans sp. LJ34]|uniref:hypothetical protein n=1 Tax=Phytohabitans sp. LJ34 TaxID=3452217 RepID=UPI003F89FBA2
MAHTGRRELALPVTVGALLGLTWAASLRGWMTHLAGTESSYTWVGTFLCLLLPGALVGALLGWAEHLRRTDDRRPARWLALAPLLFPVGVLSIPGAIPHLIRTGQGSASIGMVLLAMLAGYSLSGRRAGWWRIVCGVVGFALVPAMLLGADTPKGAWAATLFSTLYVSLALACAIPLRRHKTERETSCSPRVNET